MSEASLTSTGGGRYCVRGRLDFSTVSALATQGARLFDGVASISIDLTEVSSSDSAGLALLVEWMRQAKQANESITFLNIPRQMLSIARAGGLDDVLPLDRS